MNKCLHYISTDILKQLYLFERIKQIFFHRGGKKAMFALSRINSLYFLVRESLINIRTSKYCAHQIFVYYI